MKKAILILLGVLLSSLGWAQGDYLANAVKTKAQQGQAGIQAPESEAKRVLVFPNPVTNGRVHLTLSGFKNKKMELRIMNVIGNVIYREIINEPNDRFTITINLADQANGLYYVKLQAEDFTELRKIIID
jgi:hypothetical protein